MFYTTKLFNTIFFISNLQLNFSAMNQFWFSHWSLDYPWRDSNPRSLASETSALSTWPQGHFFQISEWKPKQRFSSRFSELISRWSVQARLSFFLLVWEKILVTPLQRLLIVICIFLPNVYRSSWKLDKKAEIKIANHSSRSSN